LISRHERGGVFCAHAAAGPGHYATVTARDTANALGTSPAEIDRMASAFEHDDLVQALAL